MDKCANPVCGEPYPGLEGLTCKLDPGHKGDHDFMRDRPVKPDAEEGERRYRKKPVVIDAVQLPARGDDDLTAFHRWADAVGFTDFTSERDETLAITTLEGVTVASPLDWIIKGVAGEFYACKPDIFEATYELVNAPEPEKSWSTGAVTADLDAGRVPLLQSATMTGRTCENCAYGVERPDCAPNCKDKARPSAEANEKEDNQCRTTATRDSSGCSGGSGTVSADCRTLSSSEARPSAEPPVECEHARLQVPAGFEALWNPGAPVKFWCRGCSQWISVVVLPADVVGAVRTFIEDVMWYCRQTNAHGTMKDATALLAALKEEDECRIEMVKVTSKGMVVIREMTDGSMQRSGGGHGKAADAALRLIRLEASLAAVEALAKACIGTRHAVHAGGKQHYCRICGSEWLHDEEEWHDPRCEAAPVRAAELRKALKGE